MVFALRIHSSGAWTGRSLILDEALSSTVCVSQLTESTEQLEELHISEDGDDVTADDAVTASQDAATTPVVTSTDNNVDAAPTDRLPKRDIPKVVIVAPDNTTVVHNDESSLVDDVIAAATVVMNNHEASSTEVKDSRTTDSVIATSVSTSNSVHADSEPVS